MSTLDNAARAAVEGTDPHDCAWPEPLVFGVDYGTLPHKNKFVGQEANDNRKGDWMQTFSGRQFWPLSPRADEIHIEDIAHSLAMQCRYAGHCLRFYSVAEHCVLMTRYLADGGFGRDTLLWALLHDASEAYLVDVPRPVKPFLPGYKEAEARLMRAVCTRFGLPENMPLAVHLADGCIIRDERVNMAPCAVEWAQTGNPLGITLEYWTPEEAETEFLAAYWAIEGMEEAA